MNIIFLFDLSHAKCIQIGGTIHWVISHIKFAGMVKEKS